MQRTILLFISCLPFAACSGYDGHDGGPPDASTTFPEPICGNGYLDIAGVEECDDGNTISGDGCSAQCTVEHGYACAPGDVCVPFCGDAIVEPGEMCDDGNAIGGDGCSADCTLEECAPGGCNGCGDGVLQPGEVCDDGNTLSGDGCVSDCTAVEDSFGCSIPGQPCGPTIPTEG